MPIAVDVIVLKKRRRVVFTRHQLLPLPLSGDSN
jgi:hypothetical protein